MTARGLRRALPVAAVALVAALGSASAAPSTPAPAASPAQPAATSTMRAREGMMPTPRPLRTCPPGTVKVGPEDPACSAFGDCCRPASQTPKAP
jgi:hypothetical protein